MLQILQKLTAEHVEGVKGFIPEDRFPIEDILAAVLKDGIFQSPADGQDEHFRPAIVNFQAAFELAAAQALTENENLSCVAVIHTPTLVKPLTLHAPDQEFLEQGVAPEVYNDPARFNTVKIRGERALPAFMNAGGTVIAAAQSTDLDSDQQAYFDVHQQEYGDQLITEKLDGLPKDMVGASYIMRDNSTGEVTFAFIRASQSDTTDPRPWIFGIGNPDNPNISGEYHKTLKQFGKLIPEMP